MPSARLLRYHHWRQHAERNALAVVHGRGRGAGRLGAGRGLAGRQIVRRHRARHLLTLALCTQFHRHVRAFPNSRSSPSDEAAFAPSYRYESITSTVRAVDLASTALDATLQAAAASAACCQKVLSSQCRLAAAQTPEPLMIPSYTRSSGARPVWRLGRRPCRNAARSWTSSTSPTRLGITWCCSGRAPRCGASGSQGPE